MNDLTIPATPGCRCSQQQLHLVGCDCALAENGETYPLMVAYVHKNGYGTFSGNSDAKFEYIATPWFDLEAYARQTYGSWATVYHKTRKHAVPDTRTAEEKAEALALARYMTQGDNT